MGRNFDGHLQGRRHEQDVDEVMFGNADTTIAQRLRMHGLFNRVTVELFSTNTRIQHVRRQKMDKIQGAFPRFRLNRTQALAVRQGREVNSPARR
jgi:hypothetical protein